MIARTTASGKVKKARGKPLMRANGYWYANLVRNGVKTQVGLGVFGEGQEPEAWRALIAIRDGLSVTEETDGEVSTVAALLDWHLHYLTRHHPKQAHLAEGIYPRMKRELGDIKPERLTVGRVEEFLDKPEWGNSTRYNYGSLIRSAFNLAVSRSRIASNPLKGLKLPKVQARIRWLTEAQQAAVLAEAKEDFRQLILVCLKTGARWLSEVASVSMDDENRKCDLDAGLWKFRQHKTDKGGKLREVVLTDEVLNICRQQAAKYPTGPLFRTASGKPWTQDAICKRWEKIRSKLGLPADCVFYSLRHTFATSLLLKGVSIHQVAVLMGNSVRVVEAHYGHIMDSKDELKGLLACLG